MEVGKAQARGSASLRKGSLRVEGEVARTTRQHGTSISDFLVLVRAHTETERERTHTTEG